MENNSNNDYDLKSRIIISVKNDGSISRVYEGDTTVHEALGMLTMAGIELIMNNSVKPLIDNALQESLGVLTDRLKPEASNAQSEFQEFISAYSSFVKSKSAQDVEVQVE